MNFDKANLPKHVALIMDGNRRWAKAKDLPKFEGHRHGVDAIEPIIDRAIELGIRYLTFWAFSTENWRRSKDEVALLLSLFRRQLSQKVDDFHKKNVRINVIGNLAMFPKDLQDKTRAWMEKTKNNNKITVNVALSYGGRDEIIRAINKWHKSEIRNPKSEISEEEFEKYLDTAGQPDPELMIRTGAAKRLSGYLIWQLEYAEFYFSDTLWPAFSPDEFDKALLFYQEQKRNFGR